MRREQHITGGAAVLVLPGRRPRESVCPGFLDGQGIVQDVRDAAPAAPLPWLARARGSPVPGPKLLEALASQVQVTAVECIDATQQSDARRSVSWEGALDKLRPAAG